MGHHLTEVPVGWQMAMSLISIDSRRLRRRRRVERHAIFNDGIDQIYNEKDSFGRRRFLQFLEQDIRSLSQRVHFLSQLDPCRR